MGLGVDLVGVDLVAEVDDRAGPLLRRLLAQAQCERAQGADLAALLVLVLGQRVGRLVRIGGPAGAEHDGQRGVARGRADHGVRPRVVLRPDLLAVQVDLVRGHDPRLEALDVDERVVVAADAEGRRPRTRGRTPRTARPPRPRPSPRCPPRGGGRDPTSTTPSRPKLPLASVNATLTLMLVRPGAWPDAAVPSAEVRRTPTSRCCSASRRPGCTPASSSRSAAATTRPRGSSSTSAVRATPSSCCAAAACRRWCCAVTRCAVSRAVCVMALTPDAGPRPLRVRRADAARQLAGRGDRARADAPARLLGDGGRSRERDPGGPRARGPGSIATRSPPSSRRSCRPSPPACPPSASCSATSCRRGTSPTTSSGPRAATEPRLVATGGGVA